MGPSSPRGESQRRSFSSPCLQVLGSPAKQACTAYGRLVRHAQRSAERQHALRRMQAPLRPELCGSAAGDVRFELAKALLRLVMERCCRLRSVSRAKSSQPQQANAHASTASSSSVSVSWKLRPWRSQKARHWNRYAACLQASTCTRRCTSRPASMRGPASLRSYAISSSSELAAGAWRAAAALRLRGRARGTATRGGSCTRAHAAARRGACLQNAVAACSSARHATLHGGGAHCMPREGLRACVDTSAKLPSRAGVAAQLRSPTPFRMSYGQPFTRARRPDA